MVIVGTPTRDLLYAGFTFDLVQLTRESPDAFFSVVQGTLLPNLRELLVETAIVQKASHVLFIDSDMRFPSHTLEILKGYDKDIVGVNCKQRTQDAWTARKEGEFISSVGKSGLEEVDTLGMGVTLIKTSVFEKIPKPWFSTPWDGKKHIGEDVYFCSNAREHGFKVFADHDLAQLVRHAGLVEFGI